jgi:hypothetical protein
MRRALKAVLLLSFCPAALVAQSASSETEEEIRLVAFQYFDARLTNDTATARQILTEEYTGINSNGVLENRTSALRLPMNLTPSGRPIAGFDHDSVQVRVYGTTAVMIGVRRPLTPSGPMGAGVRFTMLFVRRENRWQIAASQATDIVRSSPPTAPQTSRFEPY